MRVRCSLQFPTIFNLTCAFRISVAYSRMSGVERVEVNADGDVASVTKQIEDEMQKRGIALHKHS